MPMKQTRIPQYPITFTAQDPTITLCVPPPESHPSITAWKNASHILSQFALNNGGKILDDGRWEFTFNREEFVVCVGWLQRHSQYTKT